MQITKFSISILFSILLLSCNQANKQLHPSLRNKKLLMLYDEQRDGQFWLHPYYNQTCATFGEDDVNIDGINIHIDVTRIVVLKTGAWRISGRKKNSEVKMNIDLSCINVDKQIYELHCSEIRDDRFSTVHKKLYTIVDADLDIPNHDNNAHSDRMMLANNASINGISRPTQIYYENFDTVLHDYYEKGDLASLEVEEPRNFLKHYFRKIKNDKWSIHSDKTCDVKFDKINSNTLAQTVSHRYMVVQEYKSYYEKTFHFFIFGKFSEKYSLLSLNTFNENKYTRIPLLKVNDRKKDVPPIKWSSTESNELYFVNNKNAGKVNGGFTIIYNDMIAIQDNKKEDDEDEAIEKKVEEKKEIAAKYVTKIYENTYDYVVDMDELQKNENIISALRWKLVFASEDSTTIKVLSPEAPVLRSSEYNTMSSEDFYKESQRQGLNLEENEMDTIDEENNMIE